MFSQDAGRFRSVGKDAPGTLLRRAQAGVINRLWESSLRPPCDWGSIFCLPYCLHSGAAGAPKHEPARWLIVGTVSSVF